VGVGVGITGAIDAHQFDAGVGPTAQPAAGEVATNAAKSINRNAQSHGRSRQKPLAKVVLAADHTEIDPLSPLAGRAYAKDHAQTRSIS
jgi:hypothetical protein